MNKLYDLCQQKIIEEKDFESIKVYVLKNPKCINEKDNFWGNTPFLLACEKGHIDIVKLLINTDGFNSLNEKNNFSNTPFLCACIDGHIEIVKLLINTDGFTSLNEKDNNGYTPFL